MARHPRARRNARLECNCGAPVVKRGSDYVCIDCGERVADAEDDGVRGKRADPTA